MELFFTLKYNRKIDYLNGKGYFLNRHEMEVNLKSGDKVSNI